MDSLYAQLEGSCEEEAINCLREISNQAELRSDHNWEAGKQVRKSKRVTIRHRHGASCD
jgi:hypothetical protein